MSTLTDLIAEHGAVVNQDDVVVGCHCMDRVFTKGESHPAHLAAVVADWLETREAQALVASALLGRTATVGAVLATSALAAEARKGVDQ